MMRNKMILISVVFGCSTANAFAAPGVQINTDATRESAGVMPSSTTNSPEEVLPQAPKVKKVKKAKTPKVTKDTAKGDATATDQTNEKDKSDAATTTDKDAAAKTNKDAATPTDSATKGDGKDAKKAKTDGKNTKTGGGTGGGVGGVASHVGSFVAGTFVGVPVQMWRKSKAETKVATRDLVGETNNKFKLGAAGILGLPAGILSGVMQSVVYGPLDAYRGTKQAPFSPEAFSLGDAK